MEYFLIISGILQAVGLTFLCFLLLVLTGAIPNGKADKIYKILLFFTKEERERRKKEKENKRQENIRRYGTKEEKIALHNELNPKYKFLTDSQLKEKYKSLDFSKVSIVDVPCNIFDPDKNIIVNDPNYKGTKLIANVNNYSSIDIEELNKSEHIIIFRHYENYRYITKEKILENYER
jgi:hypothetical protein